MRTSDRTFSALFFCSLIFLLLVNSFRVYFSDFPLITDYKYFVTYILLFTGYFSIFMLIALILKRSFLSYIVTSVLLLLLNSYFYFNYTYLVYFGEVLNFENFLVSLNAANASVAGSQSSDQLIGFLKIALNHVLIHLVVHLIPRLTKKKFKIPVMKPVAPFKLIIFFACLAVLSNLTFALNQKSFVKNDQGYERFVIGIPFFFSNISPVNKSKFRDKCILSKNILDKEKSLEKIRTSHESYKDIDFEEVVRPNVTFLVVEGFRSDMLTADVTPNLHKFLENDNVHNLENLFSTGTSSTSGVHGLLSGLSDFYFPDSRVISYQTLPIKILANLGYDINSWRSYDSTYDEYGRYFHQEFKNYSTTSFSGYEKSVFQDSKHFLNDKKLTDKFLSYLKSESGKPKPFFNFFLWFGSHYNYFYPPESAKFKPDQVNDLEIQSTGFKYRKVKGAGILDASLEEGLFERSLKNRYKNSLYYFDQQVKPILDLVENDKNHILVILGDHGEEFWEYGRFGHVYGLNRFQTQVAGLIKIDKAGINGKRLATLADIFPTIFDYMNKDFKFLTGESLFSGKVKNRIISQTSPFNRANFEHMIITKNKKIIINSSSKCLKIKKVTDYKDEEIQEVSFKEIKEEISKATKNLIIN